MKRALVVDDDKLMRDLLVGYLESTRKFNHVEGVMSGEEALERFRYNFYDLIILDIALVLMSGVDAAIEIRKMDKDVRIIAITGYPEFGCVDLSPAGFDKCFIKPFDFKDLFDYLKDL